MLIKYLQKYVNQLRSRKTTEPLPGNIMKGNKINKKKKSEDEKK